jgi:hypothetical protein
LSPDCPSIPVRLLPRDWATEKNMMVFSMANPSNPFFAVDLFVDPPLSYEELEPRAEWKEIGGVPIHVCSINDLLSMKALSGRPEDLADIKALEDQIGS